MMRKRQKGSTLFGDCYNLGLSCPCQITQRFTLQSTNAQVHKTKREMQLYNLMSDHYNVHAQCTSAQREIQNGIVQFNSDPAALYARMHMHIAQTHRAKCEMQLNLIHFHRLQCV